jgi:uncharacterized glyoxalase superfamily protein PhnB
MTVELWRAPVVVPTLAYDDVPAAVEWLARVFGFEERADARLSWEGGGMTWMEIGDGLVHIASSGGHGIHSPSAAGGGASHCLKVYVDDLDGHYVRASAEGARILTEPQDGFWGGRIYRAQDLAGHHWEFSQAWRDLASHSWQLPSGVKRGR